MFEGRKLCLRFLFDILFRHRFGYEIRFTKHGLFRNHSGFCELTLTFTFLINNAHKSSWRLG